MFLIIWKSISFFFCYTFSRHIKGIDFNNFSFRIYRAGAVQSYVPMIVNTLEIVKQGFLADEWKEAQKLSAVPIKCCIPGPYTILHSLAISKCSCIRLHRLVTSQISEFFVEFKSTH